MKMFKKALSLLLVAVIAVTSLVCGAVSAGAYDDFDEDDNLYGYYKQEGTDIYIYLSGILGKKMTKIRGKDFETLIMTFEVDGSKLILTYKEKPAKSELIYKGNSVSTMFKDAHYEKNGSDYTFVFRIKDMYNVSSFLKKAKTVDVSICAGKATAVSYYNDTKNITVQFYDNEGSIKSISHCTIPDIPDMVYTGKALKPSLKVKSGYTLLKKGKDYTISYKNNKKFGVATVTIKGKGKYTGSVTKKFKILPAVPEIGVDKVDEEYTVMWDAVKGAKMYEIYCSADGGVTFEKTSVPSSKTSRVFNLDPDESYAFKVRCYGVNGKKKYYSDWSEVVYA